MAREYATDETLPGIESPFVLPELTEDEDVLAACSLAEVGFRWKGLQGEVFGPVATGRKETGVEVCVHIDGGKYIYVDQSTVDEYRRKVADPGSDESTQRIIMDALDGKIGEPSYG